MPMTETAVMKASTASALTTVAVTNEMGMFTGEGELTFVLWVVGGLLTVILLLLAAVCWFLREMKKSNTEHHTQLHHSQNELSTILAGLQGEHKASYRARGCAYDSERLGKMIKEEIAGIPKVCIHLTESGDCGAADCIIEEAP